MPEGAPRPEETYEILGIQPEDVEDFMANLVDRLDEAQQERKALLKDGGSKDQIADIDDEIVRLQKLIEDNEQAYGRKAKETRDLAEADEAAAAFRARLEARKQKAPFRQHGVMNGVEYEVGWVKGDDRYEAYFPQIEMGSAEAKKYGIADQIFIIDGDDKQHAKQIFEKIGEILQKEKNPYRAYAKAEAFERGRAWREPGAVEFESFLKKAKTSRKEQKEELKGLMDDIGRMQREREAAELAPPPENLPVAPEAKIEPAAAPKAAAPVNEYTRNIYTRIEETQKRVDEARAAAKMAAKMPAPEVRAAENLEERFFAQGENPKELAKRTEAIERYAGQAMTPDQAVAAHKEIKAMSARDFENEIAFTAAFLDAVEKDTEHRISMGAAHAYAEQYWQLLMKDNARLAEAMKPQPKVGFFRRLLGGAPKPKETMTAREIVQFQKMDKVVREIMQKPSTGQRAQMFRGRMGEKSERLPGSLYTGRPPR